MNWVAGNNRLNESVPLSSIVRGIVPVSPELDCDIGHISMDSRSVGRGTLFIAYAGGSVDSRMFIGDALALGASAILYDQSTPLPEEALLAIQDESHHAVCLGFQYEPALLGQIAATFYQDPSAQLDTIAITGSNGKTSVAHIVASALSDVGQRCGLMSTVGVGFVDQTLEHSGMTTPSALDMQRYMSQFLHAGAQSVAFEASSHGIEGQRLSGCYIDTAVFTNFKADHLDYHGTEAAYFEAKAALFSRPELQHAVVESSSEAGQAILKRMSDRVRVVRYQISDQSEIIADTLVGSNVVFNRDGLCFNITSPWGSGQLKSPLWGTFQAANLLAALGVLLLRGIAFDQALVALSHVQAIPGRMQKLGDKGQPVVVIDYAHNGDGLAHALSSLRLLEPRKLWCVFGCGGGRDHARRSEMGKVAELHSDHLILTNDNPRHETPKSITDDIMSGLVCPWAAVVEHDRSRAIAHAIEQAHSDDIILIAGKGHETTIDVGGELLPHSDVERVALLLGLKGVAV